MEHQPTVGPTPLRQQSRSGIKNLPNWRQIICTNLAGLK